jgi:ketosteroid isomerase-like protein
VNKGSTHLTVGGDVAFSHSLNMMHVTTTDGDKGDLWSRHTLGFRKISRGWKITHEHESVPLVGFGFDSNVAPRSR